MKVLLISILSVFSLSAHAGSLVCAGKSIYYSDLSSDLGIQPPPGTVIGSTVVVLSGSVLLSQEKVSGLGTFAGTPYVIEFTGKEKSLEKTGNLTKGSKVFKKNAILYSISPIDQITKTELARESVVCTQTWLMAL